MPHRFACTNSFIFSVFKLLVLISIFISLILVSRKNINRKGALTMYKEEWLDCNFTFVLNIKHRFVFILKSNGLF